MKRYLIILGFLIAAMAATAVPVNAAGEDNIYEYGDSFGEDLYEMIHKKVAEQPNELAVSRTLARRPLSKEELEILLPGYNVAAVLKQGAKEVLTPDQIASRFQQVQDEFSLDKELAELEVGLDMEVGSTEIFANGDETDSGFDLLADLDVIDTILFGRKDGEGGGGGDGGESGVADNEVHIGAAGQQADRGRETQTSETGEGEEQRTDQGQSSGAVGTGAVGRSANADASDSTCPLNAEFNSAANTAREREAATSSGQNAGAGAGSGQQAGQTGAGAAGGAGQTGSGGSGEPDKPLVPEKAADWSKPLQCTERFCLKFEAIYKKASSYLSRDNCIACHFEKINDAFQKTISKNLVPSKITGNLMEGSKCKKNTLGLKWNLVLVPQPIITPPNDDLIVKGDFLKNAAEFYAKYYANPGRCKNGAAGGACKDDPDQGVEITKQALSQADAGTSQAEITAKTQAELQKKIQQSMDVLAQNRVQTTASGQAEQYQVLMQQLNTMNTYFEGFVKFYNKIAGGSEESPCTILINKPDAS